LKVLLLRLEPAKAAVSFVASEIRATRSSLRRDASIAGRSVVEEIDLFPDDGGFGFDDIVKKGIERMTTNIPAKKMRVSCSQSLLNYV
jgi:hypothetical protein